MLRIKGKPETETETETENIEPSRAASFVFIQCVQ